MPNHEMQPRPATLSTSFQSRLLRLPPELIQNILSYVLATFGIQCVVRLRLVSKSFYGMMDGAVFTGNYFRDQIHICGRKISQSYLAKFLVSKVVQDHQRKTPLSQLVDGAVDMALGYSSDFILNEEKLRDDFIVVLCGAMAFFLEAQALDVYDDENADVSLVEKRKAAWVGAAATGQIELLRQMTPVASDDSQYFGPPLGMAALNGHAATTQELLQRGFQIDFLGLLTTLQAACIGGNEEIIHELLMFHSDSQKFSYEYQVAIILAIENSQWRPALHSMFCCAAKVGCSEMINAMLDEGVDIYCHDPRNVRLSAYEHAASKGHLHILKLLQARGFDLSRCHAAGHFYPIGYAIQGGHLTVLRFLIDDGEKFAGIAIPEVLWREMIRVAKKFNQGHIIEYIHERQPETLLYSEEDSPAEELEEKEDEGYDIEENDFEDSELQEIELGDLESEEYYFEEDDVEEDEEDD